MKTSAFKIKPFAQAKWEIIGDIICGNKFSPISPEVIDSLQSTGKFNPLQAEVIEKNNEEAKPEIVSEINNENAELNKEDTIELLQQQKEQIANEVKAQLEIEYQAKLNDVQQHFEQIFAEQVVALKQIEEKHEAKCLELSLAIAKKIISTTVEIKPEYIQVIIKEALKELSGTKPYKIRVSPQDYEFVKVIGVPPELSEKELDLKYEADDGITSGCKIETNYGEVDFVLENMFERIKNSLIEALK